MSVEAIQKIQAGLLEYLTTHASASLQLLSSVYRNAGAGAQPNLHPLIEKEAVGGGEWLVLVLAAGKDAETAQMEDVEKVVAGWAHDLQGKNGAEVKFGVWGREVDIP
jgi:hypothetical protein